MPPDLGSSLTGLVPSGSLARDPRAAGRAVLLDGFDAREFEPDVKSLVMSTVVVAASCGFVACERGPAAPVSDDAAGALIDEGRYYLERELRRQAIDRFDEALRLRPDDPLIQVDLAAALLLGEERAEHVLDYVRALDLADRALEQEPSSEDARERRSVALKRLYLDRSEAPAHDWEREKPRFDQALEGRDAEALARIAAEYPDQVRDRVERELMPAWAEQRSSGRIDDSRSALDSLVVAADALATGAGDRLTASAVAALRTGASEPDRAGHLVEGHLAYRDARDLFSGQRLDEAARRFEESARELETGGSPFRLRATYQRAVVAYYDHDYGAATADLEGVRAEAEAAGFHGLTGTVRWMEGLAAARGSRLSESLADFRAAARAFEAAGDSVRLASISPLIAQAYDLLGMAEEAWRQRHTGLSLLDHVDARSRHRALLGASLAADELGYTRAAIEFEQVGVTDAESREDPVETANGHARLAGLYEKVGRLDRAREAVTRASEWNARMPEGARRRELQAQIRVAEARVLRRTDPAAAVEILGEAIEFWRQGFPVRLTELYPERSRALAALGRRQEAERDLVSAIEVYEANRRVIDEAGANTSYGDLARRVFDEMVRFQVVQSGDEARALDFAERGRARLLLSASSVTAGAPLTSAGIVERIPGGVALLYFTVLDDRVLTWVATPGELRMVSTSVSARDLADRVEAYRRRLQRGGSAEAEQDRSRLSMEIHDLLIRPVRDSLAGIETLILLPDKGLHRLPFAALVDRETGRFLVEDFRLAVSPSASFLLRARDDGTPHRGVKRALVVGDPAFDRETFDYLPALPGAAAEAAAVAREYGEAATLLTGADATKSRFLDALGGSDLVHFAGHALPDERHPERSRLLLAAGPDGGEVFADDLDRRELAGIHLIVLAACGTATGRVSAAEGALNLARPFLAGGVPGVVASLWPIADDASAAFFEAFHAEYRKHADATEALRVAQLDSIARSNGRSDFTRDWAAFEIIIGAVGDGLRVPSP
jgi:CHAT domain-containing protein